MFSTRLIIALITLATAAALIPPRLLPDQHTTLTMTVWGMPFEDALFRDGYARGFEKQNPDLRINYQRYGPDIAQKYFIWNLTGRSADVMRVEITKYHALVARNALLPLDSFIDDPGLGLSLSEQADYMPAIWNALDIDGSRYALPSDNAQYGLYYNRALFDAWNAAHPDQFIPYPSADWTWADIRNAAHRLTQRDASGSITHYGIAFDLWSWPFLSFFAQAGGEIWNDDHTTTFINGPHGLRALEFIIDLIPPDAPVRSPELAESAAGPASLFAAGRVAILLDGSWRAPNLELTSPGLDFAIAPLPRDRRRAVMSGSVLWAVGAHTQHPLDAWRMIRWMTGPEQSLRYWDTLRVAPPARLSIVTSDRFRETSGLTDPDGTVRVPPMHEDDFNDRAAWLVHGMTPDPQTGSPPAFVPTGPYQADLENLIASALVAAVRGRLTPQQALDDAADALHRIIDRDRAARGLPAVSR